GRKWGAREDRRARAIAWTGGAMVAAACAAVGLAVALFPRLWMGLYSSDDEIIRIGSEYLRIVGPIYGCFGLGMALFSATQGVARPIPAVAANGARLLASPAGALAALYWLHLRLFGPSP